MRSEFLITQKDKYFQNLIFRAQFIRFFIWPRASAEGWEPDPAFDNACAELGGHLPIKVRQEFDSLTGEKAENLISRAKLSEDDKIKVDMFISQL